MQLPAASTNNLIRIPYLLVLLLLLASCSVTQIAPIQIGRISQTETYRQNFSFLHAPEISPTKDPPLSEQRMFSQTRKIDHVFTQMLGENNWQNLKDLYGLGNLRKELLDKEIYIKGIASMNIYPDPFDGRYFSVDGTGRYFLIRKETGAILLTGDYSFVDQRHSVADLEKGYVILAMDLFLIKLPGQLTYYHEAPIKYKIFIDNSLGKKRVYSIDYTREHLAFLAKKKEDLQEINAFATISFTPPEHPTKLWDFRGIQFMRRDYQQMLEETSD